MVQRTKMAKYTSMILIMAMCLLYSGIIGFMPTAQAAAGDPDYMYLLGDVDQNGSVQANDLGILATYLQTKSGFTMEQKFIADINKDGVVSFFDRELLENYLVGINPYDLWPIAYHVVKPDMNMTEKFTVGLEFTQHGEYAEHFKVLSTQGVNSKLVVNPRGRAFYSLRLYNESGTTLGDYLFNGQSLTVNLPSLGTYYVKIMAEEEVPQGSYDMYLQSYYDYDPDNFDGSMQQLYSETSKVNGRMDNPDDVDCYSVHLIPPYTPSGFFVIYSEGNVPLKAELYAADKTTLLATSYPLSENTFGLGNWLDAGQNYYLKIYSPSGNMGPYTIGMYRS